MKVSINVITQDRVFMFIKNDQEIPLKEFDTAVRNYLAINYPEVPFSISFAEGDENTIFVILNANDSPQSYIEIL